MCDLKFKLAKLKLSSIFRTSATPLSILNRHMWLVATELDGATYAVITESSIRLSCPGCFHEKSGKKKKKKKKKKNNPQHKKQGTDNSSSSYLLRDPALKWTQMYPEWITPKGWLMSRVPRCPSPQAGSFHLLNFYCVKSFVTP